MAQMSAGIQTYTNGKPVTKKQMFRLGEEQADAELRSRSGTTAMASLFADGSGAFTIHRGGKKYILRWDADAGGDGRTADNIELFVDFDGCDAKLVPIPGTPYAAFVDGLEGLVEGLEQ